MKDFALRWLLVDGTISAGHVAAMFEMQEAELMSVDARWGVSGFLVSLRLEGLYLVCGMVAVGSGGFLSLGLLGPILLALTSGTQRGISLVRTFLYFFLKLIDSVVKMMASVFKMMFSCTQIQ